MQSFLVFINVYGDVISNSTEITAPLYDLTAARKRDDSIQVSSVDIKTFIESKRRLCAALQLAHPDLEQPFIFYTYASNLAVGAVLLQRDSKGVKRAVSFVSKKLTSAQTYSTVERVSQSSALSSSFKYICSSASSGYAPITESLFGYSRKN